MANLKTRISLKYDTLENWGKSALVLNKGEVAIATIPAADASKKQLPPVMFKVGDGTHTFSELDWVYGFAVDVYGWVKTANRTACKYSDSELTELRTGDT